MKEIHNIKHSFDTTNVTIALDERRLVYRSVVLKEENYKFHVWIQEIKDRDVHELGSFDSESTAACLEISSQNGSSIGDNQVYQIKKPTPQERNEVNANHDNLNTLANNTNVRENIEDIEDTNESNNEYSADCSFLEDDDFKENDDDN